MRRTTTAEHTLKFPMTLTPADALLITYAQGGTVIINKTLEDVEVNDKTVVVELSEAETKLFRDDEQAEIQAKFRIDGKVYGTDPYKVAVRRILNDALFSNDSDDDDDNEEIEVNTGGNENEQS